MCYLCLVRRQGRDPGQMWMGYRGKRSCRCSDAHSRHLRSADLRASTGHLQGLRKVKMRACTMRYTETTVIKQVPVCVKGFLKHFSKFSFNRLEFSLLLASQLHLLHIICHYPSEDKGTCVSSLFRIPFNLEGVLHHSVVYFVIMTILLFYH